MSTLHEKYKLGEIIGSGGMGRVYIAHDKITQQKVAVKQVIGDRLSQKQKLKARAIREYNFLAAIDHPNIIKARDFFEMGDHLFLVMEFAHGVPLEKIIHEKPFTLTLKDQLAVSIQIACAIDVLNTAGIIHRDIKPLNIMVDEDNKNVKILDLGLGKYLHQKPQQLTEEGSAIGTPAYMSPEQVDGIVEENSDVFSIGITLYQFFSWAKSSPFLRSGYVATWNAISQWEPLPLWEILPEKTQQESPILKEVSALLEKALQKNPQKRLPDCRTFAQELSIIYNELKTDSTTIIYHQNTKVHKWKPSIELSADQMRHLRSLRRKYGHDIDMQKRKHTSFVASQKYLITILSCLLLTGLLVGLLIKRFFISSEVAIQEQHFNDATVLEKNIIKAVVKAKNKDYKGCAQQLYNIEKIQDFDISRKNALFLLVHHLGLQQWNEALKYVPEVLQKKEFGAVGIFYALRVLACNGEYNLLLWYGNKFENNYPELQNLVFHPVVAYSSGEYDIAFKRLQLWNPSNEKEKIEKNYNELMLQIFILANVEKKQQNWVHTDAFVKKHFSEGTIRSVYYLLKANINGEPKDSLLKAQNLYTNDPSVHQGKYDLVLNSIMLRQEMSTGIISQSLYNYPDFLPVHILLQQHPNFENIYLEKNMLLDKIVQESFLTIFENHLIQKNHLEIEKCFRYSTKNFSHWKKNYLVATKFYEDQGDIPNMYRFIWLALHADPSFISHPWLEKWHTKIDSLSKEHKIVFTLDIQNYFLRLNSVAKNLPPHTPNKISNSIEAFSRQKTFLQQLNTGFSLTQNYAPLNADQQQKLLFFAKETSSESIRKQIIDYFIVHEEYGKAKELIAYIEQDHDFYYYIATIAIDELKNNDVASIAAEKLEEILQNLELAIQKNPVYRTNYLFALDLLRLLHYTKNNNILGAKNLSLADQTIFSEIFNKPKSIFSLHLQKRERATFIDIPFLIEKAQINYDKQILSSAHDDINFAKYLLPLVYHDDNDVKKLIALEKKILENTNK